MDWKSIVKVVAPTIATGLGGPLAGLATKALSEVLLGKSDGTEDEVARVTVRLSDVRGEALRVYARVVGGELQVALALRGSDGSLRLGVWQRASGEPELTWTASAAAGGFVLSGASLR